MQMENGLQQILLKLESFIRKYYLNSMLKGAILAASISGLYILGVILAEYFGHFTSTVRTIMFLLSMGILVFVWVYYIIIPLLKLWGLGRRMSEKKAAQLLGRHFPEMGDKLQNTLELAELAALSPASADLIIASIRKRSEQLHPIPFRKAIDYRKNVKYLKYFLPVAFIFTLLLIVWPGIISEGSQRIIRFTEEFIPPPPFSLLIDNDTLIVKKGDDFEVKVRVEGNAVPNEVSIVIGSNKYLMKKESPREYSYLIKNLNNNISLKAVSGEISSAVCEIRVLPSPSILNFSIGINPPAYTGIAPSFVTNTGDLSVPYGSVVAWQFNTSNITTLQVVFNDSIPVATEKKERLFSFRKQMLQSSKYSVSASNENFSNQAAFSYSINVIPDLFPSISVKQLQDSTDLNVFYFSGAIDDDYGFQSLTFYYKTDSLHKVVLPVSRGMSTQNFYYAFDFSSIDIVGDKVVYYFEVGDNDGVRGSKLTRSTAFEFVVPGIEEIEARSEETNKSVNSKMTEARRLANEIQRDVSTMRQRMMNENLSEWERNQMMKEIADKQAQMEKLINEAAEEQKKMNDYKNNFSDQEKLMEKQRQIEDLLEQVMDEEMRKLMEELQKLMQDFDPEKFEELTKDMSMNYEEMSKELDQNLELLKRMEVEERVENTIDKLDELAKDQEALSEKSKDPKANKDELLKEQQEQEQRMNSIEEEYKKTLEKNELLKEPYQLDEFNEDFNDIDKEMKEGEQNLQENKNNKASKNQQNSSQQMKQLGEKMQSMMDQNMQMQAAENLDDLRQVLENLLSFSFDQEDILLEIGNVGARSPRYRELIAGQKKLVDDFAIIRDSLNALALRMPEIDPIMRKEINMINQKLNEVMNQFSESGQQNLKAGQQMVMTSANNLALLLAELMQQMQQQMAMQMQGNQNCKNCKSNSQSQMGQLRDLQKGMKQQMQQMIDQMKQGGDKPGKNQGNSKELAKMLAQQEIMQQMLNEMMTSGQLSPESAKILNEINRMMEDNLNDLINGNITPQTLQRQELILTRMLEVEKSEHEREIDNKRKSNEARDYKISNPDGAFDEKEKEMRFNELLQLGNVKINQFYKLKYKDYLQNLEK